MTFNNDIICGEYMQDKEQSLYIVFSSTPCKMGKFIRLITGNQYNHVSISLEPGLQTFYSFARHYKNTPFYGGFVEESLRRYNGENRFSRIKLCRIPVTGQQLAEINNYLNKFRKPDKKYIYNTISAALVPLHLRIPIRYSYTCVEFVTDVLYNCNICMGLARDHFYTVKALEQLFSDKVIFEGLSSEFSCPDGWGNDTFLQKQTLIFNISGTAMNFGKLFGRLIMSGFIRS